MKKQNPTITRRDFLKETAGGAGILAVGSGSFAASIGLGRAASAGKDANPFAYDVGRLSKTDPKLIHYEQVGLFPQPARRLAPHRHWPGRPRLYRGGQLRERARPRRHAHH